MFKDPNLAEQTQLYSYSNKLPELSEYPDLAELTQLHLYSNKLPELPKVFFS